MILCADAVLDGDNLIGDPTEGALIVLAAKGGLDVEETRRTYPRIAEVPFDSDYKFMATFHRDDRRQRTARDPLLRQGRTGCADLAGHLLPRPGRHRRAGHRRQPEPGHGGQRPHRRGGRAGHGGGPARLRPGLVRPRGRTSSTQIRDLTLLAMVGIVDPPRPEAKAAIAECRGAGIRVRMITGDHATTAAAIARELGIEGRAITGTEFAAMSDDELLARTAADRRDRAGGAGGQAASGPAAQAAAATWCP